MEKLEVVFDGSLSSDELILKLLNHNKKISFDLNDIKINKIREMTEEEKVNKGELYNTAIEISILPDSPEISDKVKDKTLYFKRIDLKELNGNNDKIEFDHIKQLSFEKDIINRVNEHLKTNFDETELLVEEVTKYTTYKVSLIEGKHSGCYGSLNIEVSKLDSKYFEFKAVPNKIKTENLISSNIELHAKDKDGNYLPRQVITMFYSFGSLSAATDKEGIYVAVLKCDRTKQFQLNPKIKVTLAKVNGVYAEDPQSIYVEVERNFVEYSSGNGIGITSDLITKYLSEHESIKLSSFNGGHIPTITLPKKGNIGECVYLNVTSIYNVSVVTNNGTITCSIGDHYFLCNKDGVFIKQ